MSIHVHKAIRFLSERLAVLQVRRDYANFDTLEARLKEATAVQHPEGREAAIVLLALSEGLTPEASA